MWTLSSGRGLNLITGANASGKTSLLEALAYLGRGKSFRGASTQDLVRHGEAGFLLFGEVADDSRTVPVGVRNGRDGLEVRVAGETAGGAAALAEALPLQLIDPEVHNLIAGGPEKRRRYIDWIAFHVEHGHLEHLAPVPACAETAQRGAESCVERGHDSQLECGVCRSWPRGWTSPGSGCSRSA